RADAGREPRRPSPAEGGRRHLAAAPLPPPLLRRSRRAGARAPIPATGPRDRAFGAGCPAARLEARRPGQCPLERHLGRAAHGDQQTAQEWRRPHRRGSRARPASRGGGDEVTEPWWISAIKGFIIVNLVLLTFAYTTLLERKVLARMQLRFGPNRAGPYGLLQPIADLVKLVRKESFFPAAAIDIPYILAPVVAAFTALAAFAVIPFGAGWNIWHYHVNGEVANVSISLILVFALGSVGIYGFIVGGWASESKYSLLGSMRTCAQMVSYEVSLALAVLGVVLMGRSLSLVVIAGVAETNRAPFDLPEADTELVGGYSTEYSGMRWGLFQMAEYVNMIVLSALAVTLFFGGWEGPWAPLGPLWFFIKLVLAISVFIWLRATLPRLRYVQLMRFGWKVLLPVATINAVITALFVVIF